MESYREPREVYTHKVKAGKRTYIFDVRATRNNDFYITITERKRNLDDESVQKQKIFLYKEDFLKFRNGLLDVMDHVMEELMPDFDYQGEDLDNWGPQHD